MPNHLSLKQWQPATGRFTFEKMAVIRHVKLGREMQIPLAGDFFAQQRELEHLFSDSHVERGFELHH